MIALKQSFMACALWVGLASLCFAQLPVGVVTPSPFKRPRTPVGPPLNHGVLTLPPPGLTLGPAWEGPFAGAKPIGFNWTLTNTTPIAQSGNFSVLVDGQPTKVDGLSQIQGLLPASQQSGFFFIPGLQKGTHTTTLELYPPGRPSFISKGQKPVSPITQVSTDIQVLAPFVDADGDTLDDNFEHAMLEHYRPYYKFSQPGLFEKAQSEPNWEPYPPMDAMDYFGRATVGVPNTSWSGWNLTLMPAGSLANGQFNAILGINSPSSGSCPDAGACSSDMTKNARRTQYAIDSPALGDASAAMDKMKAVGNTGLYGHVVPYNQNTAQGAVHRYFTNDDNRNLIKIEYWQFFPYNGGSFPHGGDWDTVQLLVDMTDNLPCQKPTLFGEIVSVFHYHHGDESRFDFSDCVIGEVNGEAGVYQFVTTDHKKVQLFRDPAGDFSHPVAFIEYATHEFWPTSEGFEDGTPNHDGNGASFLTSTPPNLGEVEAPLTEYPGAMALMRYNGYWGRCCLVNKPPPGPSLHTEWTWPVSSSIGWQLQGKEP